MCEGLLVDEPIPQSTDHKGDSGHLRQQTLIGNLQPVMQALDHAQAERLLAVQHV